MGIVRATAIGGAMLFVVSANDACAYGAIAIGTTGDIAKGGLAVGRSRNDPTQELANAKALKACRDFRGAPQSTRDRCRIISTYSNECAATAMDPKAGTPGFGYAVAANSKIAGQRAMDACKATAGEGREQYCALDEMVCDGDAK